MPPLPPSLPVAPAPKESSAPAPELWPRFLIGSVLCFLIACVLPALAFREGGKEPEPMFGFYALLFGWAGIKSPQFGWLANPCLVVAWILTLAHLPRLARGAAGLALFAALSCFAMYGQEAYSRINGQMWFAGFLPGFYLWLASVLTGLVAAVLVRARPPLPGRG